MPRTTAGRSVPRAADKRRPRDGVSAKALLRHALATGDTGTAALLHWLITGKVAA